MVKYTYDSWGNTLSIADGQGEPITYPWAKVYLSQPLSMQNAAMRIEVGGDIWCKSTEYVIKLKLILGNLVGPTNDGNPRNAMHYHAIKYVERGHIFFEVDQNLMFVP